MAIEYRKIVDSDRSVLSEEMRARLFMRKNWMYAAIDTEENSWCAYLVLAQIEGMDDMLQLHEIYIKPEYRREGIGSGLLQHAFLDAVSCGVRGLYYKEIVDSKGDLWTNQAFLEDNGFRVVVADEQVDYYEVKKIAGNKRIGRMLSQYGKMKIVKLDSFDDPLYKEWRRRMNRKTSALDEKTLDLRFSRFYIEDGEIKGAICAKRARSFLAVISGVVMDEKLAGKNIDLVRMMLVVNAIEGIKNADCGKVYIINEEDKEREAVNELLGEPDGTIYTAEWLKEI